jgi:adenylate cyclase
MASSDARQKLTAVFVTDVVGYSRLMGEDHYATLATLTEYREVFADHIAKLRGRIVNAPGDSILAEFESVVDAVAAAVEIQRDLAGRNEALPEERRMRFRIGINLGDVLVQDGDLYGEGVNIAARLESLADPGGICISRTVYEQVRARLPLEFDAMGEQRVKNISEPVHAYKVLSVPGAAAHRALAARRKMLRAWKMGALALGAVALLAAVTLGGEWYLKARSESAALEAFNREAVFPLPDKPSIAVLAFDNLSGDKEQEWFADGISENIITRLSSLTGMFVIARNSSFTYKGKAVDVRQVGRELGVRYLLEGSVLKSDGKIRVTAQLIDTVSGEHLWAESYDRDLENLFDLLDELTLKVVTQLEVELTMGDHARLIARDTNSVGAHEQLLKARKAFFKFDRESNLLSRELTRKALELDPDFSWAMSQQGWTHVVEALYGWSEDRAASLREAEALARRALAVNPKNQFAHTLLSRVLVLRGKLDEAIQMGRRAMALSPNDAYPIALLSHLLVWAGHPEEAVVLINKAMRLEPYPVAFMLYFAGDAYFFTGQYTEAILWYRKFLKRGPKGTQAKLSWQFLIAAHVWLEQFEEARAVVHRLMEEHPGLTLSEAERLIRAQPFKDYTFLEDHLEKLRQAGLPQ